MKKSPMPKSYAVGVFWSFASAFLWSTTFVCSRQLMKENAVDPVTLSFIRFLVGGGLLFGLGLWLTRGSILRVARTDLLRLAGLSLAGVVGMSVFLFFGQRSTTAINSALIMQSNPVIVMLLSVFIGEKLRTLQVGGTLLSLLGCLFVVEVITFQGFAFDPSHIRGDLLVGLSACCWAVYSVWSKPVVKRLGAFNATAWAMLLGAAELFLLLVLLPGPRVIPPDAFSWSLIAYLAVFPTAVAFYAWFAAMDRIELSLLNVMQYLTPAFTILLAWLLLGEGLNRLKLLGIGLIVAGVLVSGLKPRAKPAAVTA